VKRLPQNKRTRMIYRGIKIVDLHHGTIIGSLKIEKTNS
jgi:hypothetical protein